MFFGFVFQNALRICDDGLLKGYELDGDILAQFAEKLEEALGPLEPIKVSSALNAQHRTPYCHSLVFRVCTSTLASAATNISRHKLRRTAVAGAFLL